MSERQFPLRWDLTGEDAIIQGADWARYRALEYRDPADGKIKLWDTTGFYAVMTVRATYDGPILLDLQSGNGYITVGIQGTAPYQYNLGITIPNSVTKALADWGLGVWDLELTDSFGKVTRVYHGNAVLEREVSR